MRLGGGVVYLQYCFRVTGHECEIQGHDIYYNKRISF
jgi:hypothetical protein